MRSVKIDRNSRGKGRAAPQRTPSRATRGGSARPARAAAPRESLTARLMARLGAIVSRPMLALCLSLVVLALVGALLVGGYVGRAVHGVGRGISQTSADAGFGISGIHITGTHRTPYASVIEALGMKPGESIFGADLAGAYARLSHLPWVASVDVQRRYPDAIFVTLVEKRPFALWQMPDQRIAIVERSGGVITTEGVEKFARLPKLVGAGAAQGAADLVDAVASHRAVAARVAAYERQSERRWNLILNDGVVVKLPESGWAKELDALEKLIIDDGILERDVAEIDLRSPSHFFFMLKSGDRKDVVRGKDT